MATLYINASFAIDITDEEEKILLEGAQPFLSATNIFYDCVSTDNKTVNDYWVEDYEIQD